VREERRVESLWHTIEIHGHLAPYVDAREIVMYAR